MEAFPFHEHHALHLWMVLAATTAQLVAKSLAGGAPLEYTTAQFSKKHRPILCRYPGVIFSVPLRDSGGLGTLTEPLDPL